MQHYEFIICAVVSIAPECFHFDSVENVIFEQWDIFEQLDKHSSKKIIALVFHGGPCMNGIAMAIGERTQNIVK